MDGWLAGRSHNAKTVTVKCAYEQCALETKRNLIAAKCQEAEQEGHVFKMLSTYGLFFLQEEPKCVGI